MILRGNRWIVMIELKREEFKKIEAMLPCIRNKAVFACAVLEQKQRGRVFVNNAIEPTAAFVTSCGGFYCVLGEAADHEFNDEIAAFLNDERNHIGFYALGMYTDEWERALLKYSLQDANPITRVYFQLNVEKFREAYSSIPDIEDTSLRYEALNECISNKYREEFYTYYQLVWDSARHFCEKGVGHFITKENNIISVCTSPYVGGGYAEIDVITVEEYKRQGLASHVGARFISDCLERNLMPSWSCHSDNPASLGLACKLGFEPVAEHSMYWYNAK